MASGPPDHRRAQSSARWRETSMGWEWVASLAEETALERGIELDLP